MSVGMLKRTVLIAALTTSLIGGARTSGAQDTTPLAQAPAAQDCAAPATGSVLFLPVDDGGKQLPGVGLANPATGETAQLIDTPMVDRLSPLPAAGLAVASTADGQFLLIDPADRSATPLEIDPDVGSLFEWQEGLRVNGGERFTILSDGRDAYLLDVAAKRVTDLRALLPADSPPMPLGPFLSADEEWMLYWDGIDQWILPTNDPSAIRSLTPDDQRAQGASFSPDGQLVIYSRWMAEGDRTRELVIEPADGSAEPEVVVAGDLFNGVFVGGADTIAYVRYGETDDGLIAETMLLDRSTGEATSLHIDELNPTALFPSPDGTRLLLEIMAQDGPFYLDIDLATGVKTALTGITGHYPRGAVGARWLVLMPQQGNTSDVPRPGYSVVDLATGAETQLTEIDADAGGAWGYPIVSVNGRSAITGIFGPDENRVMLFDLAGGRSVQIRDGSFTGFAIAPDGCRFVVADRAGGSDMAPIITVDSVDLNQPVTIGPGLSPIWVNA